MEASVLLMSLMPREQYRVLKIQKVLIVSAVNSSLVTESQEYSPLTAPLTHLKSLIYIQLYVSMQVVIYTSVSEMSSIDLQLRTTVFQTTLTNSYNPDSEKLETMCKT